MELQMIDSDPLFLENQQALNLTKREISNFYTRFECSFTSSTLVLSVFSCLLHSFRV
jgi:hypothetical protein